MQSSLKENSTSEGREAIPVAVAVIRHRDGRMLLGQRPATKSYPLQWEFPGGKVEPGERSEEALVREIEEELGVTITVGALLHEELATYSDGRVFQVRYYLVEEWTGDPVNREFAAVEWVAPSALAHLDILEGNRNVCRLLADGLPEE